MSDTTTTTAAPATTELAAPATTELAAPATTETAAPDTLAVPDLKTCQAKEIGHAACRCPYCEAQRAAS